MLLGISLLLYVVLTFAGQVTRFFGLLWVPLICEVLFLVWFFVEVIWAWVDTRAMKEVLDQGMWAIKLRVQIFHSLVYAMTIILFALDIPAAFSEDVECATGFGGRGLLQASRAVFLCLTFAPGKAQTKVAAQKTEDNSTYNSVYNFKG